MSNRAFRISFCHKVGKFVIEVQGPLALYWSPAKQGGKPQYFESYTLAREHVNEIGLAAIYTDCTKGSPWQEGRSNSNALASFEAKPGYIRVPYPPLEKQA
jgi:hypothetical protein